MTSSSVRPCGCRDVVDDSGHVLIVGTCPLCLPPGSISWLIDNGRQLDLFRGERVDSGVRGGDPDEPDQVTTSLPSEVEVEDGLPF